MNNESKFQSLLGFASKAGKVVAGTAAVENAIKKKRVFLVICAADLAARTIKNFQYWCQESEVPFYCHGTRAELGKWIGLPERGIIGIASRQFAALLQELFIDRGELP
jgi:ribosomal protein L7Ae-like RNA K-turn-binding protein